MIEKTEILQGAKSEKKEAPRGAQGRSLHGSSPGILGSQNLFPSQLPISL